jgi:hypothetical protein
MDLILLADLADDPVGIIATCRDGEAHLVHRAAEVLEHSSERADERSLVVSRLLGGRRQVVRRNRRRQLVHGTIDKLHLQLLLRQQQRHHRFSAIHWPPAPCTDRSVP